MINHKQEVLAYFEEEKKKGLVDIKMTLNPDVKSTEDGIYKSLYSMIEAEKAGNFTRITEL